MTLEVLEGGLLTTLQDLGRFGYERYGVPVSGAMDPFALRAANRLVGNPPEAAGLEMVADGPVLYAWHDCLAALTGGGFNLEVGGRVIPGWMAAVVRQGETIRLLPSEGGTWGYLAVSGGIRTEPVLGSRSTYLRGGFGGLDGRALAAADLLPIPAADSAQIRMAGNELSAGNRPAYREDPVVRVILGPQANAFSQAGVETFLNESYTLTTTADRMGYRFEGPAVEHNRPADILSDGIVFGAIQVPANGQPIVMMSDRQTTGGYTKIAAVISADLPILAQCRPGTSRVRFQAVTIEVAQAEYRRMMQRLETGIRGDDRDAEYWQG